MLLGVGYFFVYVPKNEKTVQQRRFRCLQNIDTNIHSKIENSISLLYNLLPDTSGKPVRHPQVGEVFERDDQGGYKPRNAMLN